MNTDFRDITYRVDGLTCEHCRSAVAEAVAQVPGVGAVEVDLVAGRMRVSGRRFEDAAVADVVAAEGYEVAS